MFYITDFFVPAEIRERMEIANLNDAVEKHIRCKNKYHCYNPEFDSISSYEKPSEHYKIARFKWEGECPSAQEPFTVFSPLGKLHITTFLRSIKNKKLTAFWASLAIYQEQLDNLNEHWSIKHAKTRDKK